MVEYQSPHLDAVFHALSDPTRRAMLHRLSGGEQSVSQLGAAFRHVAGRRFQTCEGSGRGGPRQPARGRPHPLLPAGGSAACRSTGVVPLLPNASGPTGSTRCRRSWKRRIGRVPPEETDVPPPQPPQTFERKMMRQIEESDYGVATAPNEVRFERSLPGPVERVWAYLTEADKRPAMAGGRRDGAACRRFRKTPVPPFRIHRRGPA